MCVAVSGHPYGSFKSPVHAGSQGGGTQGGWPGGTIDMDITQSKTVQDDLIT